MTKGSNNPYDSPESAPSGDEATRSHASLDSQTEPSAWAVFLAGAWFGQLLMAYFIVRPVREMFGVKQSEQLSMLFFVTFVVTFAATPVYSYLAARLRRRTLISLVYRFFAAGMLLAWAGLMFGSESIQGLLGSGFFVFVTLFALFNTSVFWTVITDLYSSQAGKRHFGRIASGGTMGALAGSAIAGWLAKPLGSHLLLIPVVLLECGIWTSYKIQSVMAQASDDKPRNDAGHEPGGDREGTGGSPWEGIGRALSSPYMLLICVFLFFVNFFATHIYHQQAGIVKAAIIADADRTAFFAKLNLGVQLLTLVLQGFVTSYLTRRLGLRIVLVLLPLAYLGAFVGLAMAPQLATIVIGNLVVRSVAYGVAVPSREVLFTVVSREDKYKSKNFIDTVVLRGADAVAGPIAKGIGRLGASAAMVNLLTIPLVLAWGWVGYTLGKWQRAKSTPTDESDVS